MKSKAKAPRYGIYRRWSPAWSPLRLAAAAAAAAVLAAAPQHADQRDPRLDDLLIALRQASTPAEGERIESVIWSIWMQHSDPQVRDLMAAGQSAMDRGDLERAVDIYSDVVEAAPEFAEGWNRRATAYYYLGALDASEADIERVLALEPRHFGALSGLAMIELARGENVDALETYQKLLKIYPMDTNAALAIRELQRRLGGTSV